MTTKFEIYYECSKSSYFIFGVNDFCHTLELRVIFIKYNLI